MYTHVSVHQILLKIVCRGLECKEPQERFLSRRNIKCCQKTNQLQSVQGYGKQITHKNIHESKKQKKVLPWQHLLSGVAEKLISSSLCRGMESKEPIKIFMSPRNRKKCCHGNTCCQVSLKSYSAKIQERSGVKKCCHLCFFS